MRRVRISWTAAALTLALSGLAFSKLTMPFFALPAPSGAQPVGTIEGVVGTIPVQFWYPADAVSGARRAVYRPEVETRDRSIRERLLFPLVRPAAYLEAPAARGRHAVVFYVSGWGEKRSNNTALCEDLASHGFVVVAMDDQLPHPAMDFTSDRARKNTVRWANTKVGIQSRDVSNLLTALERVAPPDPTYRVTSTMDFRRVAALGFSFGGATAAEAALHDSRIAAAVNLDGWTFGDVEQLGIGKPFMTVSTGAPTVDASVKSVMDADGRGPYEMDFDRENGRQMLESFRRHGGYLVTVDGTGHESFTDAGFLSFKLRPAAGSIDGRRAARITAAYVDEFMEFALDGRRAPLLTHRSGDLAGTSRSDLDAAAQLTTWVKPAKLSSPG